MGGLLSARANFNDSELMRNELSFCADISKIGIVKMYKRMRLSMQVKLEEVVEEALGISQERQKMFKSLQSSQVDFEADSKQAAVQSYSFPDTFHFEHRVKYENLTRQYLSFYFYEDTAGKKADPVSVYRVALNLLANGPVHHDVALKRIGEGCFSAASKYSCRFHADIKFVQTQQIEI
mmetsp:Transcript_27638/g.34320  ORF Transcript_27638/g.34320 Transcript_27638/m.34320 type:complete len:179 (-) Transcript_27638:1910-2446(-)